MRDIRPDLSERLDLIQSQKRALANQLRALESEENAVKALLDAENRRFLSKEPARERPSLRRRERGRRLPNFAPEYGVRDFVVRILADRETMTLGQLKQVAEERNLVLSEGASLGRTIHGALLGLLKQGRVEQADGGIWKIIKEKAPPIATGEAFQ